MNTTEILNSLKDQLADPARAGCNCESAFAKDKIAKKGLKAEAAAYWTWVCGPTARENAPAWVTDEIYEVQKQLVALEKKVYMPAWGTYGT